MLCFQIWKQSIRTILICVLRHGSRDGSCRPARGFRRGRDACWHHPDSGRHIQSCCHPTGGNHDVRRRPRCQWQSRSSCRHLGQPLPFRPTCFGKMPLLRHKGKSLIICRNRRNILFIHNHGETRERRMGPKPCRYHN